MRKLFAATLLCASVAAQAATVELTYTPVTTRADGTTCNGCTHRLTEGDRVIADPVPTPHRFQADPGDHTYGVAAVDATGLSSIPTTAQLTIPEPAVEPPVTAPPAAPLNVKLVAGTNTITVSWQPVAGAVSYSVLLDGSVVGSVKGTSSMRTVAPGKCLTPYHKYTVVSVDASKRRSIQSLPASLTKVLCVPAPCVAG